ncbi:MAG: hypothetical protein ACOC22_02145 [bacterium]
MFDVTSAIREGSKALTSIAEFFKQERDANQMLLREIRDILERRDKSLDAYDKACYHADFIMHEVLRNSEDDSCIKNAEKYFKYKQEALKVD